MSRVVNTNSPGKQRSQLMRTAAELLRHLRQKATLDDEAKDMAALLLLCLREIDEGIEASAEVWEKRDYWIKAEQLRQRWVWAGNNAARLENVLRQDVWDKIPQILMDLFPQFADIKITKFTRDASAWQGVYPRVIEELKQS